MSDPPPKPAKSARSRSKSPKPKPDRASKPDATNSIKALRTLSSQGTEESTKELSVATLLDGSASTDETKATPDETKATPADNSPVLKPASPSSSRTASEGSSKKPKMTVEALHNFTPDEKQKAKGTYLTMKKGDRFIIKKSSSKQWWLAVSCSDKDQKGWVPASFVKDINLLDTSPKKKKSVKVSQKAEPKGASLTYIWTTKNLSVGEEIASNRPTLVGATPPVRYSIDPEPQGLVFDPSSGTFYGPPRFGAAMKTYTVTASWIGDQSVSTEVSWMIASKPPKEVSYAWKTPKVLTRGDKVNEMPSVVGDKANEFTITPEPIGLNFNADTGELSGLSTVACENCEYTIAAKNTGGEVLCKIAWSILATPPKAITPWWTSKKMFIGDACENQFTCDVQIDSYTICPEPIGLSFNTQTGALTGPAEELCEENTYIVTAKNQDGEVSTELTFSVVLAPTKAEKRAKKRLNIAKELCSTEKSYIEQLKVMEKYYCIPLMPRLAEFKLQAAQPLFSNVTIIRTLNEDLLKTLEERASDPAAKTIGDAVKAFCQYTKVYQSYAKFYSELRGQVDDAIASDKKFREFCSAACQNPDSKGLTLASLMITPIQRVPRYILLLQELLKNTPEEHKDQQLIPEALESMNAMAHAVDNAVKAPHEGYLTRVDSRGKPEKKRYYVLQNGEMTSYLSDKKDRAQKEFPVNGGRVAVYETEDGAGYNFTILPHGSETCARSFFKVESQQALDKWLSAFVGHGAYNEGKSETLAIVDSLKDGYVEVKVGSTSMFAKKERYETRYIVLLVNEILLYKAKPSSIKDKPLHMIPVTEDCEVVGVKEGFSLQEHTDDSMSSTKKKHNNEWMFRTKTDVEANEWVDAIKKAVVAVAANPLDMDLEDVAPPTHRQGYLDKKGGSRRNWKKRYFYYDCPYLHYYTDKKEFENSTATTTQEHKESAKGYIELQAVSYVQLDAINNTFAVQPSREAGSRKYIMKGANKMECESWAKLLREGIRWLKACHLKKRQDKAIEIRARGHSRAGLTPIFLPTDEIARAMQILKDAGLHPAETSFRTHTETSSRGSHRGSVSAMSSTRERMVTTSSYLPPPEEEPMEPPTPEMHEEAEEVDDQRKVVAPWL